MGSPNDIIDTVNAMCHQESTGYSSCNWVKLQESVVKPLHLQIGEDLPVDLECRTKMIDWCIQVVDFCKFRRETVEIAINYLDRFLCSPQGTKSRLDRSEYRLACMTALYTAVKIHEPSAMDPKLVSKLSHGAYTPEQVEKMEACLLSGLQWRVNPPTSLSFARNLVQLLPHELTANQQLMDGLLEICQLQTEASVGMSCLLATPASTISAAALLNALESLDFDVAAIHQYMMSQGLFWESTSVNNVRTQLYETFAAAHAPTDIHRPAAGTSVRAATVAKPALDRCESFQESPRAIAVEGGL